MNSTTRSHAITALVALTALVVMTAGVIAQHDVTARVGGALFVGAFIATIRNDIRGAQA